jgi:two-component system sensor histidine kinase/response regulator
VNHQEGGARSPTCILLVEDNATNQFVAENLLRALGLDCVSVSTGVEALQKLSVQDFSAVLMDVRMPEMDGYEATERIRAGVSGEKNSSIPIIAITANAGEEERQKCLSVGMNGFLEKPIRVAQLAEALSAWCPSSLTPSKFNESPKTKDFSDAKEQVVFDEAVFLRRMTGDTEIAKRAVQLFLEESPNLMRDFSDGLRQRDMEGAELAVHSLKSAAAGVGGVALAAIARDLESKVKRADFEGSESCKATLESEYSSLVKKLTAWVKA